MVKGKYTMIEMDDAGDEEDEADKARAVSTEPSPLPSNGLALEATGQEHAVASPKRR